MIGSFLMTRIKYWAIFTGLFIVLVMSPTMILFAQGAPNCTTICYVNGSTGNNSNTGSSPDDALASIRIAIDLVSNGGEIIVAAGIYHESMNIYKNVTISGAGADVTIIDGTGFSDDPLDVTLDVNVIVQGFTITNSSLDGFEVLDGQLTINNSIIKNNSDDGIYVHASASLIINNSAIIGNRGEGIVTLGAVTLNNSTISGNLGYGIDGSGRQLVTLNHVTIANNNIGLSDINLTINNSIIANNTGNNCSNLSAINIVGNNLQTSATCGSIPQVTASALALGVLANNGGSTPTHALGFGSVAIDAVDTCGFATDQRGIERPQHGICDIGAYESDTFATITITKSVVNGDTSQSFDFDGSFDFSLSDGESETFNVLEGMYEFTEIVTDGWTFNGLTDCGVLDDNQIVPVTDGSISAIMDNDQNVIGVSVTIEELVNVVCTFENERDLASLTVTKTVIWGDTPVNPAESFEICISGPSYAQPDCDTVGAQGGDLEWDNLIPGTYTVTETNPGADWNISNLSQEIEVTIDGENTASITNTNTVIQTGSLAVTKIVNWGNDPVNQAVIFEICITGPSYPNGDCLFYGATTSTQTWTDLQPGPYTVDEVNPVANWIVDEPAPNTAFFVVAGQTTEVSVTNTYDPVRVGTITANVNVNWNGNPVDDGQTFTVCLSGTAECRIVGATGGSAIFNDMPVGDYVVFEQNPGGQWAVTGGGPVTVTNGGNVAISVNNVHDPALPDPVCDAETDLSGWIDIGATTATGHVVNNNSITCEYQIGMASYQMFDDIIDNQVIVDSVNVTVTLAPGEQTNLTVNIPACATQIDLFYGETLQNLNGVRYGNRLLDYVRYTTPGYCTP